MDKITYKSIKKIPEVNAYIEQGNRVLGILGYTEHSRGHAVKVAETAGDILEKLGYNEHTVELAQIAGYMHDMGNSLGGMESYIRLLDQYEDYQGGFIWDYIDQALFVKDEVTGRDVLRYGGDFDDRPSDYEFSGNGILFADRTEKPAMQEVRHYYGLRRLCMEM